MVSLPDRAGGAVRGAASLRQLLVRHEGWVAALAYALVLATIYSNIVFFGDSLVYSNNFSLNDHRVTPQTHGPSARPTTAWFDRNLSRVANLQDPSATWTQWEPGGVFLLRSIRQRHLPFWDPYTGGGVPAMANLTPAFFFPPYLLVVALGNGVLLKNFYFLALLLAAAWCTWALLRRTGLSWSGSFLGGLAFMLSGGLTQTIGSFIGQTACCLPVGLLATRWFLERCTWTAAAGLALAYASIALASFPPLLIAVFGLSAAYACAELLWDAGIVGAPRRTAAARFAAAVILAGALVAFYYLPVFSLMGSTPHVAAFYRHASAHTTMRALDLLQLFAPALLGGAPIWANDPIPRVSSGAFHYVGAVTLLLAALTSARAFRRPLWLVALAATVFVLGVMLGVTPFDWLRDLPVLRNTHFGNYYGIVLGFLLALFAAAGFEHLTQGRPSGLRSWAAVLPVILGVLAVLLTANGWNVSSHAAYSDWRARYVVLVVLAFATATIVFWSTSGRGHRLTAALTGWMLVALLLAEGAWNAHFPRQARWEAWEHPPPHVEFLRREPGLGRVFTIGASLYANSGTAYGIAQLDSLMAFNPPRMFELYRLYAKGPTPLFLRDAAQVPPDAVLDAANISHITTVVYRPGTIAELKARGYEMVFFDGLTHVFRRSTLPRFFFTSAFTLASEADALTAVGRARPPGEIVVESPPPLVTRANEEAGGVPVTVEHFSNNYVRLSVTARRAGFVYASDAYFPGWTATVNGRRTPIQPANYAFKAVPVPAGPVTLELRYSPPGFLPGLGVSIAALLSIAGLLTWSARSSPRARSGNDEHLTRKEREQGALPDPPRQEAEE